MRKHKAQVWAPPEYWELTEEQLTKFLGHRAGCGPGGLGDYLVPDKLYGVIDVTAACKIHDFMYEVALPDLQFKEKADRVFLNNMVRIVLAATSRDSEQNRERRRHSLEQAKNYYNFVKWFGGPSFWANKNLPEEMGEIDILV